MIRLENFKPLGRKFRRDDVPDLATPTLDLARKAIQAGKLDEALDFMEYGNAESTRMHDALLTWIGTTLTWVADTFGEEQIEKLTRKRFEARARSWLSTTPDMTESLQLAIEQQRGHGGSSITVTEEADRYVVKLDPCGSGGKLRRTVNLGATKKAYPWSWNKAGVPYYCIHCCLLWEIIPIELRGHQIRLSFPGDKPEDPCTLIFYKDPKAVPEEYFARVGKTKKMKQK